MKVIVLGGNGFIASHFGLIENDIKCTKITDRFHSLDTNQINKTLKEHKPDIVINTIGYGGNPNVDACEVNIEKTYNTNTILTYQLSNWCLLNKVRFIHIGSGCIFNGASPHTKISHFATEPQELTMLEDSGWKESDVTNHKTIYSRSKYAADLLIESNPYASIIRIRMPISKQRNARNLLTKIIKYKRVVESFNSVTFMGDLTRAIEFVINKNLTGIYHCASDQPITHSMLLGEYQKYYPDFSYEKISSTELNQMVVAPRSNCVLDNSKLKSYGFQFQDTQMAIKEYVKDFINEQ